MCWFELRGPVRVCACSPRAAEDWCSRPSPGGSWATSIWLYNGRAREQILAGQLGEHNGRPAYDIWTSFEAHASRTGAAEPVISASKLPWKIDSGSTRPWTETYTFEEPRARGRQSVGANSIRGLMPCSISRAMEVTAARIDGAPAELLFRESERSRVDKYMTRTTCFRLLIPRYYESSPGRCMQIEFDEEGSGHFSRRAIRSTLLAPAPTGIRAALGT